MSRNTLSARRNCRDKVVICQFKTAWSAQFYCRAARIPYHIHNMPFPQTMATGALPQLRHEKDLVPSGSILGYLQDKFTNLESDLGLSQRGQVKALCSLIECELGNALEWCYWGDEEHYYAVTRKQLCAVLPFPLSQALPYFLRKSALHRLSLQGIASEEQARSTAKAAYKALSGVLGDKLWLLGGDRPTTADVLLFGHLMDALVEPINEQVNEHPNLLRFCDRVRQDFFENPDFESPGFVSQNCRNYFEGIRGIKLTAEQGPLPVPTASKRVPKGALEEDLDELGKRKTKKEQEEEEAIARGNRNSIIAAVVVVASYFVANFVEFEDDDEMEEEEDFE